MTGNNKRRTTLWVSAGIVTAAVLAGGIGVGTMIAQTATPADRDAAAASPTGEPNLAPVREGACDVPGGDITAVPADLSWETVQGFSWPVSPSLGPTAIRDGFPVCFSHSPIGAALAANTVLFETLRHEPSSVSAFYAVDSVGKAAAVEDASDLSSSDQLSNLRSNGMSLAGYRIDEYTADRALVYLVLATPDGRTGYRGMPFPLVWVDGDWRVKVLDTGKTGRGIDVLEGQFVEWTG